MQSTYPQKITLLRLSAIGDVLMLLPAVRLLKKHYPTTQIDWLIDRPIASLLSELTEVTIIPINKPRTIADYWRLKKQWQGENTGQLISFQTSLRSNILTALLHAELKTGFGQPYAREGHQLVINTAYPLPEKKHQVEIFYALAQKFIGLDSAVTIPKNDLSLPLNDTDINWAQQQLSAHEHWIAINPMASTQEKTWSTENYIALINEVQKSYPEKHIVLTGGPSENEIKLGKEIQANINHPCLNLVAQTTLSQLASVLKQVELLISPDTGPLHLANAVSTQVIGLYAVTRLEYVGPYHQLAHCISVFNQTSQTVMNQSAQQLGWQKKIPSLTAMNSISVDHVLTKIKELNV